MKLCFLITFVQFENGGYLEWQNKWPFSIQDHRFSGKILHPFCIFNRKIENIWHLYCNSRTRTRCTGRTAPSGCPTAWRNSHALSRKPPPQPPSGGATVGCSVAVDEKLRAQAAALDRHLELRNKWPFFNTKSSFFKGNSPFRSTSPEIAMEVHFPWMEVSFAMQKRSSRASAAPNA